MKKNIIAWTITIVLFASLAAIGFEMGLHTNVM